MIIKSSIHCLQIKDNMKYKVKPWSRSTPKEEMQDRTTKQKTKHGEACHRTTSESPPTRPKTKNTQNATNMHS